MTGGVPGLDVDTVLDQLKDFQRASAAYVFRRMYGQEQPASRFLLADEVGLGKTLVARAVIAQAVAELGRRGVDRIDVLYVCSNGEIARQNVAKINPLPQVDVALASRITLLPLEIESLVKNRVNFISFTPGTSLDPKSQFGMARERCLLYRLLLPSWGMEGRAARNLFAGWSGKGRFRRQLDDLSGEDIDSGLADGFRADVSARIAADRAAGRPDLRSRLEALLPHYEDGRASPPADVYTAAAAWIRDARALLARSCVDALEPDLVILDEFQRFKHLLDGKDPASELARQIFEYPGVRVLLVSATPYKMYTLSEEAEGDDHYRDFLQTLRFLFHDDARTERLRGLLDEYRRRLFEAADAGSGRLSAVRDEVEALLRSVMVRTERLAATDDRSGMLEEKPPSPTALSLRVSDIDAYLGLQRVARLFEHGDTVEFWKSAPYVLNFMDTYVLKRALKEGAERADKREPARAALSAVPGALLGWKEIERYERIDPSNARLRWLLEQTVDAGAWRLLWLPPTLPYYRSAAGPYSEPALAGLTKRLVFSSWKIVPKAIAALLSYEAERRAMRSYEDAPENTAEARDRRRGLLRFSRSGDGASAASTERLTGMPVLGILYPCAALARAIDPLGHAASGARSNDVVRSARSVVETLLSHLPSGADSTEGAPDQRWYWAAPLQLDRVDPADERALREWFLAPRLAERWAGEDDESDTLSQEEARGWAEHVEEARGVVEGRIALGRRPPDLADILARVALSGPGVVALRALLRACGDGPSGPHAPPAVELRDAAGSMAHAFRSLFNLPEAMAIVRGLTEEPYWQGVLEYGLQGNLQSVVDEFVHVLREQTRLSRMPDTVAARLVADGFRGAVGMRTSSLVVDEIRANASVGGELSIEPRRLRVRFSCRLGEEQQEAGEATTRADQVRASFNSPFWPFVLSTTSVGQEGLDFHPYCHAIVHWNLPANPVDLEQREGRIHRYKGHAVRKNLAARFAGSLPPNRRGDPWDAMFALAVLARPPGVSELEPFWVLNGNARIERHVPALPLSRDARQLVALRKSLAVYRMVFGQPRQEELAAYLATRLGPDLLERVRAAGQVRLAPGGDERKQQIHDPSSDKTLPRSS